MPDKSSLSNVSKKLRAPGLWKFILNLKSAIFFFSQSTKLFLR